MLKLYVLITWLSKQWRFPGDIHKSRTDKSFLGMMEVQWSQEGVLRQDWESFCKVRVWCILTICEGEMEMSLHPNSQHCVWNFEWSIYKWKVFAKMESWMSLTDRLSSLPPPSSARCPHSFRLARFFVMKVCLYSFHLTCSLFSLVLLLQV